MDPNFDTSLLTQVNLDNIVIAEYMGGVVEAWYPAAKDYNMSGLHVVYPKSDKIIMPDNKSWHCASMLKYDSDWNWLMPVFHKVDSDFSNESWDELWGNDQMRLFVYPNLLFTQILKILKENDV